MDDELAPPRVLQAAPAIRGGSGVAGAASAIETALRNSGAVVSRLTLKEISRFDNLCVSHLCSAVQSIWFTAEGTRALRRRSEPDEVTICHNDALAGDLYVNHGLLRAAFRAEGRSLWRIAVNPLHVMVLLREHYRYSHDLHRTIVCLSPGEVDELLHCYPRCSTPVTAIGHGVDTDRFHPADDASRTAARHDLGLPTDAPVVLFIGHDHNRKGLPELVEAMQHLPHVHVLAVGGTARMRRRQLRRARRHGVSDRLHLRGPTEDAAPLFHAADVLCQPSAYESFGLVVLEAMASGIPVVSTSVGCATDLVTDQTGRLVSRTPSSIAEGVEEVLARDPGPLRSAARHTAEQHTWEAVAQRYLSLIRNLQKERHCG